MRRRRRLRKRDILVIAAIGALLLAGLFFGAEWLEEQNENPEPQGDYHLRYEDSQITVNGVAYRQKSNLTAILFMGIDSDEEEDESRPGYLRYQYGGQADFLRLMVIDSSEKTITQIAIDRDTMTPITVLSVLGKKLGYRTSQICLSHSFGDGKEQSCEYTVEAVSNLLYNIPIKYYVSLNLNGISVLNDALGGVTVTLEDDFSHIDPTMTQGTTLTLKGQQAEIFVRSRRSMSVGTNTARMRRQQTYVAQMTELLNREIHNNSEFVGTLFDALSPYLVSSMSRSQMINEAWKVRDYERLPLVELEGVHQISASNYMEFHVDEDALEQTVLALFYEKVK